MTRTFALAAAAAFMLAAPAAASDDAALFKRYCGTCHGDPNVEGSKSRLGPDIVALKGRTAGKGEFVRYSPALKSSKMVWDHDTLDAYLLNPRAAVRGTTMAFPGLRNEAERKAIVVYLLGDKD